jgi:hypothetical protein
MKLVITDDNNNVMKEVTNDLESYFNDATDTGVKHLMQYIKNDVQKLLNK